jgi:phosphoenolpyruvate carboxykinase (GTP)
MGYDCPGGGGIDWKNNPWKQGDKDADGNEIKGAHPNSRFTARADHCPVICEDWENPAGVPIDIFVFGGKRTNTVPLVHEAFDWEHGVFMGATASSEPTAAALDLGNVSLRFDPFAMTPFIGYHAGDYMEHWFEMGEKLGDKAPKCFYVNWFRKDENGKFMWPGFGENSRVLKWMCDRVEGKVEGVETKIGLMPKKEDFSFEGLDLADDVWEELLKVDVDGYKKTLADCKAYLAKFGDKLPTQISAQLEKLEARLNG